MRLMWHTEWWLDEMEGTVDEVEGAAGVDLDINEYAEIAEELRSRVTTHLFNADIEYKWSYQQSVGAGVVVQSATPEEQAAYRAALDSEEAWLRQEVKAEVQAYVRDMQEVSDE